jgi:hypothetical protein
VQFVTDSGNLQNFLSYDVISMPASTLVFQTGAAAASQAACQDGCGADSNCQYAVWFEPAASSPDGVHQCFWRDAGASVVAPSARIGGVSAGAPWPAAKWDAPAANGFVGGIVLFEVKEGAYVAYPATTSETIGETVTFAAAPTTFAGWKAACDGSATCIGLQWTGTSWRAFKGALQEGAVGKVRAVGNAINSWVAIPTGTEEPLDWTTRP